MSSSPQKRASLGNVAPIGNTLGNRLLSFAKSRLPVPNKPRTRTHRHTFLSVAPIPFAPLVDTHMFQPPPPYSVHADDSRACLRVPHNTPEVSPRSRVVSASASSHVGPVGLGLEGVERGDGCRFDGLGRLSGGFRGTHDALREEVRRMLSAQRRRAQAGERPAKRHDVFYAAVEVPACERVRSSVPKVRMRRKSAASPTPAVRRWEGVRRGTISSELKRAASVERRASLGEAAGGTGWRV